MNGFRTLQETLTDAERVYICDLLAVTQGKVAEAARLAGCGRVCMWRKIARFQINPKDFQAKLEQPAMNSVRWLGAGVAA